MSLQSDIIQQLSLGGVVSHKSGWKFQCPFCSDLYKESKKKEKCAVLLPVDNSKGNAFMFHCQRGIFSGKGDCNHSMSFSKFLQKHNPDLYKQYLVEKEKRKEYVLLKNQARRVEKILRDGTWKNKFKSPSRPLAPSGFPEYENRTVLITDDAGTSFKFDSSSDPDLFFSLMNHIEGNAI